MSSCFNLITSLLILHCNMTRFKLESVHRIYLQISLLLYHGIEIPLINGIILMNRTSAYEICL